MSWSSTTVGVALARLALVAPLVTTLTMGCAPRTRMCTASTDCRAQSACVAGRCQSGGPNVKPAIDAARRLVVRPVELAYLRRGASGGALPPVFSLGRDSAVLMMRFSVALPSTAKIIEAYVVLRRSDDVDDDPAPISLHGTRIVEAWDARSISWARQPRLVESRTPATVVEPGGPSLVRIDVRDIVKQWPQHDARDNGVAIVAENETRSGTTFAYRALGADRSSTSDVVPDAQRQALGPGSALVSSPDVEPYLELYVR